MQPFFLGGAFAPAGLSVGYLRAPFAEVFDCATTWRRDLNQQLEIQPLTLPETVAALEPFEAPWTRELLFDCGAWTAYVNNSIDGGDPSAAAPYLARSLDVDLFIAIHAPKHDPGHASTQLWVIGPGGVPPMMYRRTICANAEDGRWSWHATGDPLPFEEPERYAARLVRDRLDRSLLIKYLDAVGIRADDPTFYGDGVRIRELVTYPTRQETAAEVRDRFGW